uniref:Apple domain-containing protein n=1 Tax=Noctiluca scintillans TaxID=2966 RepID=A0A7S0ZZX0_NOCSC
MGSKLVRLCVVFACLCVAAAQNFSVRQRARNLPPCLQRNTVLRHDGKHGLFADVSTYGHEGCFLNNCKNSDKFTAAVWETCARLCHELAECTHWSYGDDTDGASKCFMRTSDAGRQPGTGWFSGAKDCGPPPLSSAFVALSVAQSRELVQCDRGKSESCTDVLRAVLTWKYAIKHLFVAARGSTLDDQMQTHMETISKDSDSLITAMTGRYRPSDKDFTRVVYNNRLIFNALSRWLALTARVELSPNDASLPNPLRFGTLCGRNSCYEL